MPFVPDFVFWLGTEPSNLKRIKEWVGSMSDDPAELCVLHNFFERETASHNVPPKVFLDFFERLGELLTASGALPGDLGIIRKITDERPKTFYVQGTRHPRVSVSCSRFVTVDDFISM